MLPYDSYGSHWQTESFGVFFYIDPRNMGMRLTTCAVYDKGPVRGDPGIPNTPVSKDQYPNIPISKDQYPNINKFQFQYIS